MTSRERLMAVFNGAMPDRLPWSPCMDNYFTESLPVRTNGKRLDVVDVCRLIGADIMERHVPVARVNWKNTEHIRIQDGAKEIWRVGTPVGNLERISVRAGNTSSVTKYMANSIEDIKVFSYIFEHMECTPDFAYFLALDERIGSDGIATVSAEASPIKVIMELCAGLENTAYLLSDYPDEMEALMEQIHQASLERLKVLIESPAEVIIAYEDTSTTVLSDKWYEKYSSPYINACADLVSKSGKLFITHMCGKLKGFVNLINKDRMHGIDSVCPPDTGDLWAHEALVFWPGKIIIGGIDPVALCHMTADETRIYVQEIIAATAGRSNFILSTGDAVAYGTPLDNLRAVTDVCQKGL